MRWAKNVNRLYKTSAFHQNNPLQKLASSPSRGGVKFKHSANNSGTLLVDLDNAATIDANVTVATTSVIDVLLRVSLRVFLLFLPGDRMAVKLLVAARPRSDVAVSDLIERLADEDWLIVTSVILALGDFGPLAAAAIPQIEA